MNFKSLATMIGALALTAGMTLTVATTAGAGYPPPVVCGHAYVPVSDVKFVMVNNKPMAEVSASGLKIVKSIARNVVLCKAKAVKVQGPTERTADLSLKFAGPVRTALKNSVASSYRKNVLFEFFPHRSGAEFKGKIWIWVYKTR